MKCQDYERLMLLRQTGELTSSEYKSLSCHIETCHVCSAYAKSLDRLCTDSRKHLLNERPSKKAVSYVINKGRERDNSVILSLVRQPAFQWLALAASMVIMAGTCLILKSDNNSVHSNGSTAFDLISIATYDADTVQVDSDDQHSDTSLLADKLLEIEGFSTGGSDEEFFTLFGEPSTTDPQSRSSLGSPSRTHV